MASFDIAAFRNALGQFPTGVAVVTTKDSEDRNIGMTVSSFNSVSLNPPLVLWSIDKESGCFDAFQQCEYFAINVLTEAQKDISNVFAQQNTDKFASVDFSEGNHGLVLIDNCAAYFQCKIAHRYEGGDHIIIVGEVEGFESFDKLPLVFHNGNYAQLK